MSKKYDVLVIGGGAAGLFAASVANKLGSKTCIIEKEKLGGDCTWYGCIPSKAILKAGEVVETMRKADSFGLQIKDSSLTTDGAMDYVRKVISRIAEHHTIEEFQGRGIDVLLGAPKFLDRNSIEVNGQKIGFGKAILCTGTHPVVPPIKGLKDIDYLTNNTLFGIEKLPQSLIVLGGGPIGVEMAQSLNLLGVKVSIVEMMDRILIREDRDIASVLEKRLTAQGIHLLTGQKAINFENKNDKVVVTLEGKSKGIKELSAEKILVAVGRAPNTQGLDLEKAGIQYDKKGVKTNPYLQTTNEDVFACGDLVGPYMFSHVAAYQASVGVRNALHKRIAWQKVNYTNVGWATFTHPEVAHLGLTEEEAKEKGLDFKVYTNPYGAVDRAVTDGEEDGLVKILVDKKDRLLGAHIAGAKAGELMQGFSIAKTQKIPVTKLAQVFYIYPTLSELVKKTCAKPLVEKLNNPFVKFILKIMKRGT